MRSRTLLTALTGAFLFIQTGTAQAAFITFEYFATVQGITDDLGTLPAAVGSPVHLSFTFDSSIADSEPGFPELGSYPGAVSSVTLSIGATDFFSSTPGRIDIGNSDTDAYQVRGPLTDSLGYFDLNFTLTLGDPSGTVFSSDSLPLLAPDPGLFDLALLHLTGGARPSGQLFVVSQLNVEDALQSVPEPAGIALFAVGLTGLVLVAGWWGRDPQQTA